MKKKKRHLRAHLLCLSFIVLFQLIHDSEEMIVGPFPLFLIKKVIYDTLK